MTPGRRRGRWLVAGGILGLALSPQARRAGLGLRARAARFGRPVADPVEPFRQAPCYEHDRAAAGRRGGPLGGGPLSGPPVWRAEVLVPAHRIVFALRSGEVVELRGSSTAGTFGVYRGLPDAVHGMIAWPNTVLLSGPELVVVDPGYATQGEMLAGALGARGISPDDVRTVVMTHLHSDHVSALPQLGEVDLHVHEAELATPHARAGRGFRDAAVERPLAGTAGELAPGLRWILTPGHTDGHVAVLVDTDAGVVAIAGDTPGPDPSWFARMELPADHPRREEHLAAFRAILAQDPSVLIPGHNPPVVLRVA